MRPILEELDLDVAAWVETVKEFGRIYRKRQFWHLRNALVPRMGWGLSATGEVWTLSSIYA